MFGGRGLNPRDTKLAMDAILTELAGTVDAVIDRLAQPLPAGFPDAINRAILEGLKTRSARLMNGPLP